MISSLVMSYALDALRFDDNGAAKDAFTRV
jgi:hypothetical protein